MIVDKNKIIENNKNVPNLLSKQRQNDLLNGWVYNTTAYTPGIFTIIRKNESKMILIVEYNWISLLSRLSLLSIINEFNIINNIDSKYNNES